MRKPTFVNQFTVGDLLSVVAILIACIGLFLNLLQMQADSRQKRAEYIINLSNQATSDQDIQDIYYKIEYEEFIYDEDFHESDDERKLDKLLEVYENMAKLYQLNNITLDDLDYVAYSYLVVYQDSNVQDY